VGGADAAPPLAEPRRRAEPGQRDRTIAAAIDGVGLVLVPILAVWLVGKLLTASQPPPPIDNLLAEFSTRADPVLLVLGLTATALALSRAVAQSCRSPIRAPQLVDGAQPLVAIRGGGFPLRGADPGRRPRQ
jgi:hypothetical protein